MDFSTAYFGKPLDDLEYNDIVEYFSESKEETETIEFKSFSARSTFDAGLQTVIRGLSAFLNSSGGILIWGAPLAQSQDGRPEHIFVGNLSPVTELVGKDRLINRISSAIVPLPVGIKVNIVESNDCYLYIFEVQESIYKPHQYDTRYYVRLDGQTKPAPHYLIDALMKQVSYPNLNGVIKFHQMTLDAVGSYHLPITVGLFNFTELQNEEKVSFRVMCVGGYFQRGRFSQLVHTRPHAQYSHAGEILTFEDFISVLHFGTPHVYNDHIVIDQHYRQTHGGQLNILLSFGGKKSPAKTSSYDFDFSRSANLDNPTSNIIQREENLLYSEHQQRLNTTPEDSLRTFFTSF